MLCLEIFGLGQDGSNTILFRTNSNLVRSQDNSWLHHCGYVIFGISQMNCFLSDREHVHFLLSHVGLIILLSRFIIVFYNCLKIWYIYAYNSEFAIHLGVLRLFSPSKYFPEHKLPDNVIATTDAKMALLGADFCLHAVPVQVIGSLSYMLMFC